jgi:hypothetical protein
MREGELLGLNLTRVDSSTTGLEFKKFMPTHTGGYTIMKGVNIPPRIEYMTAEYIGVSTVAPVL